MNQINKSELGSVASLLTGYKLYSDKPYNETEDKWHILQLRDFDDHGKLLPGMIKTAAHSPDLEQYSIGQGDVLFAGRSTRIPAILAGSGFPVRTAASSHFYIVRPDRVYLEPAYLAWFLNHPTTRSSLSALARGTYIPFVPMGELEKLAIPLPSLDMQRSIAAISSLNEREHELTHQITALNTDIRNALTWRAAHA